MSITWYRTNTISTFSKEDWQSVLGNNILKSYEFINAIEKSEIKESDIQYIYSKDGDNISSIIPIFVYDFNLDLLTSNPIKLLSKKIRRSFPNFLRVKILFVGTPVAICDHLIGIKTHNEDSYKQNFKTAFEEIKKTAIELNSKLILFKEVPASETTIIDFFKENGIALGKSLPNSYLLLDDKLGRWREAFKTRYRRRINRQVKDTQNNDEFRWMFIDDFREHSDTFEHLYHQILNKSDYQFETLNSDFFSNTCKYLKDNSKSLICLNGENKIVCFELIITQGDIIIPIYLGMDYNHLKQGDLYFSCINRLIIHAEENDYKKIKFGQTSYRAKSYIGAIFEELILGAYSCNPLLNKFISIFHKKLFQAPNIPEIHVYRKEMIPVLESVILDHNISPLYTYNTENNKSKCQK